MIRTHDKVRYVKLKEMPSQGASNRHPLSPTLDEVGRLKERVRQTASPG
jgi:hypothetical protein